MHRILKLAPASMALAAVCLMTNAAYAQNAGGGGGADSSLAIGAALAIAIAVLGGALGQGRAAAAALDGIARNPQASGKIFTPMIIGLALMESLVLLAFLIAFTLSGKIGS